jgi:hypothetical protein
VSVSPTPHRALVTSDGRIDRAAVMLLAHQRTRREAAFYSGAGIVRPSYRVLFAVEMKAAWEWARTVSRGDSWKTLYRPEPAQIPARRALAAVGECRA